MAVYSNRDIESSFEGDVELDAKGDLKLADALVTHKSAANFVLRTDYGHYTPNSTVGCNLGSFVGKTNTPENHRFMEYNITKVLKERIFSNSDVRATVVPFDINEVLCLVDIAGAYLIDNIIQVVEDQRIAYTFPYIEGTYITPITIA